MTRALWLTAEPPRRDLGGGNIRQAHLLAALANAVPTDVLIAGHLDERSVEDVVGQVTEVEGPSTSAPANKMAARAAALRQALLARVPYEVAVDAAVRQRLARALVDEPYDLVCVEHARLAPLVQHRRHARWVLTLHNLPSGMAAQALAITEGRRQRWLLERERGKGERFERRACKAYDAVIVTSDEDSHALPCHAAVVPNGVDAAWFRPSPLPERPALVMTGTFSFPPNVEGALWFCRDVLPLIRAEVPDVTLDLVGREPAAEIEALNRDAGITVHGSVPDVRPFLASARAAVVPVRIGTGTRLKALEAMAAARPVVGTSVGLGGLGLVTGRDALVADDPAEMAEAIVAVLGDDGVATRLAQAGRSVVEERFDWAIVSRSYVALLLEGADGGPATAPVGR